MSHRVALARGRSRIPEVPAESSDHEQDSQLEHELIRQNSLGYGGLIAIGVILVQPFLTAVSLDPSAKICIAANSVAIPLHAALILVSRQEVFRRRRTKSTLVAVTQVIAQGCGLRWRGRRVLAHPVDRRGRSADGRAHRGSGPLGRLCALGTRSGANGRKRNPGDTES